MAKVRKLKEVVLQSVNFEIGNDGFFSQCVILRLTTTNSDSINLSKRDLKANNNKHFNNN